MDENYLNEQLADLDSVVAILAKSCAQHQQELEDGLQRSNNFYAKLAEAIASVKKKTEVGLRELCSKSSSLFYSEFPQKLYHYAHYYSQNLLIILIILIILNFTAILFQLFFTLQSKCATILCSGLYYIKFICNSLLQ